MVEGVSGFFTMRSITTPFLRLWRKRIEREIADYMGLKRTEGIPATIAKLKLRMKSDHGLFDAVETIKR